MTYPMRQLVVLLTFFAPPVGAEDKPPAKPADARRAALVQAGYTPLPLVLKTTGPVPAALYLNFFVDGAVGAEKVKFFLDCGLQDTFLDLKLAGRLKLVFGPEVATTGVDRLVGRRTEVAGLMIGSYDTHKHRPKMDVQAVDLSSWLGAPGGVLGMEVLDPGAAVVDYPARALYLRTPLAAPDARKPPADPLRELLLKDGYTAVRLEREPGGLRTAAARVGRHDLRLLVDTGASFSVFDTAGLDKWGVERLGGVEVDGLGGKVKGEMVSLRGLTLGVYDTRRAWFDVYGGGVDLAGLNKLLAEQKRPPIQGMLGNLDLFTGSAVIDFGTNTLYLRPVTETVGPELEGKWVGVRYEFDGQKGRYAPGREVVEFKGGRIRFTIPDRMVERRFHLRNEGDHYRLGLFDSGADELADGFKYSSGGLLKLDGGKLTLVIMQGRKEPTEFAAPKGSELLLIEYERAK